MKKEYIVEVNNLTNAKSIIDAVKIIDLQNAARNGEVREKFKNFLKAKEDYINALPIASVPSSYKTQPIEELLKKDSNGYYKYPEEAQNASNFIKLYNTFVSIQNSFKDPTIMGIVNELSQIYSYLSKGTAYMVKDGGSPLSTFADALEWFKDSYAVILNYYNEEDAERKRLESEKLVNKEGSFGNIISKHIREWNAEFNSNNKVNISRIYNTLVHEYNDALQAKGDYSFNMDEYLFQRSGNAFYQRILRSLRQLASKDTYPDMTDRQRSLTALALVTNILQVAYNNGLHQNHKEEYQEKDKKSETASVEGTYKQADALDFNIYLAGCVQAILEGLGIPAEKFTITPQRKLITYKSPSYEHRYYDKGKYKGLTKVIRHAGESHLYKCVIEFDESVKESYESSVSINKRREAAIQAKKDKTDPAEVKPIMFKAEDEYEVYDKIKYALINGLMEDGMYPDKNLFVEKPDMNIMSFCITQFQEGSTAKEIFEETFKNG